MLQMQTSAAWSVERSKTRAWLRGGDDSGAFPPAHLELDHEQRPLPRSASAFRTAVRNTVKIQGIPPNRSRTCPPITGRGASQRIQASPCPGADPTSPGRPSARPVHRGQRVRLTPGALHTPFLCAPSPPQRHAALVQQNPPLACQGGLMRYAES